MNKSETDKKQTYKPKIHEYSKNVEISKKQAYIKKLREMVLLQRKKDCQSQSIKLVSQKWLWNWS